MLNFTGSSWFPLWKFKVGDGECDPDYMLGSTKFSGLRDFLTGERIQKYTTVIWNRRLGVNLTLDNYLRARKGNDKDALERLQKASLSCDLKL